MYCSLRRGGEMKKQSIFTIFVVVSILSAFSIFSMTGRLSNEQTLTNQQISNTSLSQNKKNLICSAQGDIRPPAWDEDEDKTANGS
jgi:hypothetical protein